MTYNIELQNNKFILNLVNKSIIKIEQINGQRRLTASNWIGPPPGPGTEIFVGKLPRDIFEDQVYPFFSQAGFIYELRMMMDFSGNNRGYCFISYSTPEEAERAIQCLNNREIVPGKKVGVIKSINNCKLWIGRLPKNIKSAEVILKICSKTADVDQVAVYKNVEMEAEFAIATYKTHRGAAMARRALVPEKNSLFSNSVSVDWANPDITPCNMVEESGLAVKNEDTKNLYFLKSIKRKVIGYVGNRSFPSHSKPRGEVLYENIDCYIRNNLIISSADQDPANLKVTKKSNMSTSSKQKKPSQKQPSKMISAREAPSSWNQNSPFRLPRPVELSKQHPSESFSLFDDFTFSHSPTIVQKAQGWVASFDQFQNLNRNNYVSNCWVDSVIPRCSSLNLQSEEARSLSGDPSKNGNPKDVELFSTVVEEKALPGKRAKIIGSINAPNPFQPMICPEKGFPFYPSGSSSVATGMQCPYGQIPGISLPYVLCPISYADPWAQKLLDNRAYFEFNQHHCLPSNCAICMEAYTHSHRMQFEHCNLAYCNQQLRLKEVQVGEDTVHQQQSKIPESNYQNQTIFRGRRKQNSVPKMNPRRRKLSENQEIAEQQNFISKPAAHIPKGARPILSARK